jgi:hypothetical protein
MRTMKRSMTSTECGNKHVDQGVSCVCDKTSRNHQLCSGWSDRVEGYVDWPNPDYQPPSSAGESATKATVSAIAKRVNGAAEPARGWSTGERLLVESAITQVAEQRDEFTVDHVWMVLGDQVPKTTGMAALLKQASSKGYVEATEKYADSRRADRDDHDQGRRLRVWKSLMR